MTKKELIFLLNGTEFYVNELHYSELMKKYVNVKYPVVIDDTTQIVEGISWQDKTMEEILDLATEYLNLFNLWLLIR